jgi:hypothetical protein
MHGKALALPEPVLFETYLLPIFKGKTYNPTVAFAITRLAQERIPFIDFSYALNHLPNFDPTSPYPNITECLSFLDDLPSPVNPSDLPIQVIFIPGFFQSGHDCIGYVVRSGGRGQYRSRPTLLFTPCTMDDLAALGLLRLKDGNVKLEEVTDEVQDLAGAAPHGRDDELADMTPYCVSSGDKAVLKMFDVLQRAHACFNRLEVTRSGRWINKFSLVKGKLRGPNREYGSTWRCVTQEWYPQLRWTVGQNLPDPKTRFSGFNVPGARPG